MRTLLALVLFAGVACSAGAGSDASRNDAVTCVKNATFRCACGDLKVGRQSCDAEGKLSECDCSERRPAEDAGTPAEEPPQAFTETTQKETVEETVRACAELLPCCELLAQAGFTGSEAQCRRAVEENSATGCTFVHSTYRTPDPESDFVCP